MEGKIAGKYRLLKKLGSGAFGQIYQGINSKTFEEVAVKLESGDIKHPQLEYESKVYRHLEGANGIPKVMHYGKEGSFNIMVMDLLGLSLEDLFSMCHRKFSIKTTLMIAEQMFERIRYIHYKNMIHRDIKPDNFLIGIGKMQHIIYIIDFGLAKRYRDPKTGEHIKFRNDKSLTGTARYASIFTHLGEEQARRDDLESIGFVLLYFLRGSLPWQGTRAKDKKEKYDKIKQIKISTTFEVLCKGFPEEFLHYLKYCHTLGFEEKPDYDFVRKLFKDLFQKKGFEFDYIYDWVLLKNHATSKIQSLFDEPKEPKEPKQTKNEPNKDNQEEDKKVGEENIFLKKGKMEMVDIPNYIPAQNEVENNHAKKMQDNIANSNLANLGSKANYKGQSNFQVNNQKKY